MVYYGLTDKGKMRAANQDIFRIKEYPGNVTLAVVCDGMGGANGGETASKVAVSAFVDHIDSFGDVLADADLRFIGGKTGPSDGPGIPEILTDAVSNANVAVYSMSVSDPSLSGMGTTLVAALVTERSVYAVNVGDSRMYLINGSGIRQITRDHSYVQHLIDLGRLSPRKARTAKNKNIITRAVGTEESVKSDLFRVDKKPFPGEDGATYILLCSDGLTNMAEVEDIAQTVTSSGALDTESLRLAAENLVKLANDGGGMDNITAVLLAY